MAETLKSVMAVMEYRATANLRESLLKMNRTSDAMKTTGAAPRWNHPRSFGGAVGASVVTGFIGKDSTLVFK